MFCDYQLQHEKSQMILFSKNMIIKVEINSKAGYNTYRLILFF